MLLEVQASKKIKGKLACEDDDLVEHLSLNLHKTTVGLEVEVPSFYATFQKGC
jgi:hypothetical protein